MLNQVKAVFATYFLHMLHGQVCGFHTLINLLNCCKDLQLLIFWDTMAHILVLRNLTCSKLMGINIFGVLLKLSYLCNKHCVNNFFADAVQKTFKEVTRFAIQEYCGYALQFAPDRLEASRRSLSCIKILSIQCKS